MSFFVTFCDSCGKKKGNKTITSCSIRRVSASLTVYVLYLVSASLIFSKALVECVLAPAVALQPFAKSFAKQEALCDGEHLRRSAKGFAKAFAKGVAKGCMCERFCEKLSERLSDDCSQSVSNPYFCM